MRKITNCFVFLLFVNVVLGQQYEGKLSKIKKDGLYRINVSPQVRSSSSDNLDYLRIINQKGNEVPYVKSSTKSIVFNLVACKIIEKNSILNKKTSIVVENNKAVKLDRLLIRIGNSAVTKKYSISGSNDKKEWFGLVYNQEISNLSEPGQISVDKEFLFPLNNYKYIRFDFTDKDSMPINVLSVFYSEKTVMDVPVSKQLTDFDYKIVNDKIKKRTTINLRFASPQVINAIRFNIAGPDLYLREASVKVNRTLVIKRKKTEFQELLHSFQLNSNSENFFEFEKIFEKDFIIEIENQDNPILDIKSIELLQRPLHIIASLKSNEKYKLLVDSALTAPSYDLVNFDLNSKAELPVITIENFGKVNKVIVSKDQKFWKSPWFLWSSIFFGGILIAYFAFSLVKDLEQKE